MILINGTRVSIPSGAFTGASIFVPGPLPMGLFTLIDFGPHGIVIHRLPPTRQIAIAFIEIPFHAVEVRAPIAAIVTSFAIA